MSQTPAPPLLRLREADIVRLCGLAAAGEGLRLADRHALQHCRRRAGHLAAAMDVDGSARDTWVEVREGGTGLAFAWGCGCVADGAAHQTVGQSQPGSACAHVAAILTTWLRDPAAFSEEPDAALAAEPAATPAAGGARQRRGKIPAASSAETTHSAPDNAPARTLHDTLALLPLSRQEAIAQAVLGEAAASLPAEALGGRLAEALADPPRIARLLAELDPPAAALLWAVRLLGGSITSGELEGLAERHRGGPAAVTSARHQLQTRGLLFRSGAPAPSIGAAGQAAPAHVGDGPHASEAIVWYVPLEVATAIDRSHGAVGDAPLPPLPAVAPHGPPSFGAAEEDPSRTPRAWVHSAPVRQLFLAAALLAPLEMGAAASDRDHRERARQTGAAQRRAHGALGASLPPLPGDPPSATLATWAASTHLPAGLLRMAWRLDHSDHGDHDAPHSARSLATLSRLPAEEWAGELRTGFQRWLGSETYCELADLTLAEHRVHARCDPHHEALRQGTLASENAVARRAIVAVVAHLGMGAWYALDDLLDLMWWMHPWFLRARQRVFSSPAWWLAGAENERPLRARVREEWRRAEGQYITYLLTGPLHWWGVLDVAGAREQVARAVRLTALGAYLVGREQVAPDSARALASGWGPAVLPVREVMGGAGVAVQPCAASPALLDALDTWARAIGPAGDRVLWRFSNDLAARAFDAGIAPDALLALLRAADERDHTHVVPGIAQVMADWRARYGASRIEIGGALLEAVDAPTLREALAHAPEIAAHCRQISPTCALVPAELAAALAQTLDRRGFAV